MIIHIRLIKMIYDSQSHLFCFPAFVIRLIPKVHLLVIPSQLVVGVGHMQGEKLKAHHLQSSQNSGKSKLGVTIEFRRAYQEMYGEKCPLDHRKSLGFGVFLGIGETVSINGILISIIKFSHHWNLFHIEETVLFNLTGKKIKKSKKEVKKEFSCLTHALTNQHLLNSIA